MFWKSPASCLALFVSRISSSEISCCEPATQRNPPSASSL
jgi:hypothetical protein